jgi:hypothetical protein
MPLHIHVDSPLYDLLGLRPRVVAVPLVLYQKIGTVRLRFPGISDQQSVIGLDNRGASFVLITDL